MIPMEIQAAVEKARRYHGKFVFVEENAPADIRDALESFARENGREVLNIPDKSRVGRLACELANRDVPVINKYNHREFIDRLKDIAVGRAKVE